MTDTNIWEWIKRNDLKAATVARAIDVTEMTLNCYKSRNIPTKAKARLIRFIEEYEQGDSDYKRDSVLLDKLLDYLGEVHPGVDISSRRDLIKLN